MITQPKVTIIMATYNRAHLIEETLESIVNQTYTDWECLIIDDGGTDNTEEVIKNWLHKDARFTYSKRSLNHQKGLPGCRNQGIELAKGEFIIFFDDDDIVHPQNLELCLKYFEQYDKDFVHYSKKNFKTRDEINYTNHKGFEIILGLSRDNVYKTIIGEIYLASCTIMWKKHVFEEKKFNEELQYAEEWDLYNRLLLHGFKGDKINLILYFARKHKISNTASFYNNEPIRVDSKMYASISIIKDLDDKNLLKKKYINFFIGLKSRSEVKQIYKIFLSASSLNFYEKIYLILRYRLLPFIKFLYLLKRSLIQKSIFLNEK